VNGSMEMDKAIGSSLADRAILCSDVIVKVGVPKALKWALDIGEGERLSSLGCFSGTPLFL
jgi:hypothetical protein